MISIRNLSLQAGQRKLIRNLNVEVAAGQCLSIIGQNGTGKTSLLQSIAGLHSCADNITIKNQLLSHIDNIDRAQLVGILMQSSVRPTTTSVENCIALGRYPYQKIMGNSTQNDQRMIHDAMERFDLASLAGQDVETLSGGEWQRVRLAMLFVQDTEVVLLDEPFSHLDAKHKISVLRCIQEWKKNMKAVVMVLHDLNITHAVSDYILALKDDSSWLLGNGDDILSNENLAGVFDDAMTRVNHVDGTSSFSLSLKKWAQ